MILRVTSFDNCLQDLTGFKLLNGMNPDDFNGQIKSGSTTALFDATCESAEVMLTYAKDMVKQDYSVNGILVVITDGMDNASTYTAKKCRGFFENAVREEVLESLVTILVGVNVKDQTVSQALQSFKDEAGFREYIELDNANEKTLARLADFVSKSISAQSQALGTGGPSKSLSF